MGIETVQRADGIEVRELRLGDLLCRADRCGVLSARGRAALRRRLAGGGPYPAIIVRRHPSRRGKYEILDGCCRAEALRDLGAATARCETWPAADDEAAVLAITLNYLRGGADALRRAQAAGKIVHRLGEKGAAEAMGLTPARLRQWLRPLARAEVKEPAPPAGRDAGTAVNHGAEPGLDLRPLVFHVTAAQAETIERALRLRGQAADPSTAHPSRGDALAKALAAHTPKPGTSNRKK